MAQFALLAALLAVVAVAFAIFALWRTSRGLALALTLGLPLAAAGLYWLKGNPAALDAANLTAPKTIEEMVTQLEQRMASDPGNFEGQVLLARSYMAMEKFERARDAYAKARALKPDDADLGVEYAEALMRSAPDHRFPPAAIAMLETAVAQNPQNQRALFFIGMDQLQSNQPAQAAATWEKVLPLLTPDTAAALRGQINLARAAAQLPPLPEIAAIGPTLAITVRIDPSLAKSAAPGDTLYVFARTIDGAGPPLAVKRIAFQKLPTNVTLSDADSPMPAGKLSSQNTVLVMARLSKSGNALPGSGDIESEPVAATLSDSKTITVTLSRAIP